MRGHKLLMQFEKTLVNNMFDPETNLLTHFNPILFADKCVLAVWFIYSMAASRSLICHVHKVRLSPIHNNERMMKSHYAPTICIFFESWQEWLVIHSNLIFFYGEGIGVCWSG